MICNTPISKVFFSNYPYFSCLFYYPQRATIIYIINVNNAEVMKLSLFFILTCFTVSAVFAQIQKQDWIGKFAMNHDGWQGTLVIEEMKADCASSPWCDLNISYTDASGNKLRAEITRFSQDWQSIDFQVRFPQQLQKFKGYIFSRDKSMLAGTTVWINRTFGFYAKKQPTLSSTQVRSPKSKVVTSVLNLKRQI